MSKITLHPDSLKDWQDNALEYLRYDFSLSPNDLIVDVGAYRGEWAEHFVRKYNCRSILIEPSEYINGFNFGDKYSIINKAASTHDGVLQFGGRAYYTSIFEQGDHEYPCFDIATVLQERIKILKLNCEGSEYEIMEHILSLGLQKNIENFQIQFHMIEGVPFEKWYNEIVEKLKVTHELEWRYQYCWENWRIKI